MKLIFCLDDEGGIAFNKRRQSRDPALVENITELIGCGKLFASEYTAKLFSEGICTVCRDVQELGDDDWYFSELISPIEYIKKSDTVVIYRWNRLYPSDVRLENPIEEFGLKLSECCDFTGIAHKKITREIYVKV